MSIAAHVVDVRGAPPGKTYHGNAEPEGQTAVVGGVEVVVGGWAAYEAARRRARWEANPHSRVARPRSYYGGRTYITGQDAVESLIGARVAAMVAGGAPGRRDPLARAAERLAAAVEAFEAAAAQGGPKVWARLGVSPDAPLVVSTVTADDIRHAAPETDVHELHRCAEDAAVLAAGYARADEREAMRAPRPPGALPPLPSREVSTRAAAGELVDRNVARLEAAAVPRASAIEAYRGRVAVVFDASAAVLERAVESAGDGP